MSSRKQLDQERAKLDAAKAKFREAKKQFEIDKRKLETEKKALKSEKNRLAKEKKQLKSKNAKLNKNMRKQLMSPVSASAGNDSFFGGSPRSPRGGGGDGKYQKKYEIETKKTRELRSKVGDLEAQIKSLSRKLKYGGKLSVCLDWSPFAFTPTTQSKITGKNVFIFVVFFWFFL